MPSSRVSVLFNCGVAAGTNVVPTVTVTSTRSAAPQLIRGERYLRDLGRARRHHDSGQRHPRGLVPPPLETLEGP